MPNFNNCQLNGYETPFPNSVYVSHDTKTIDVNGEPTNVKRVVILTRYLTQTEEDVVRYLREKANNLAPLKSFGVSESFLSELSPLERSMIALPEIIIENIKSGHEGCTEFLKQTTSAPEKDENSIRNNIGKCIQLRYGLIPYSTIEKGNHEGLITSSDWYQQKLSDDKLPKGIGEMVRAILPLTEDWELPASISDMNILLKYSNRLSSALVVYASRNNPSLKSNFDEVKKIINAFYLAFPSVEHIMSIKDSTDEILEKCSKEPIGALLVRAEIIKQMKEKGASILNLGALLGVVPSPEDLVASVAQDDDDESYEEEPKDNPTGRFRKEWLN